MRKSFWIGLSTAFLGLAAVTATACGEDDALVRPRVDGGGAVLPDGGTGGLACGAAVPTTYVSASFATNAAVELALGQHLRDLDAAMANTEGSSTKVETAGSLAAIFNLGAPSLRTVSTTFAQTTIDSYLTSFGAAGGKVWQPTDAEADGGAAAGGKYGQLFYESPTGIDLRAATTKTLLAGALYNHVLGLVASPVNDATIDRLVAAFGATPAFANNTDVNAGPDGDRLVAELASKRDDKTAATGIYRQIRSAVLMMKAAVGGGEACLSDLDGAIKTFLLQWERATYASAIFSLNAAISTASDPAKGPLSLHAYGDALGLIQSFKGLSPDKRKISDAQIDLVLSKLGADTPYKLVTAAGTRVLALGDAINEIALYEGFTGLEVESYKNSF